MEMSENEYKIDARDVRVGMYVSKLDRPWLETPFMLQGFMINDQEDLNLLRQHCHYCYVDADRSKHFHPNMIKRKPTTVEKNVTFGIRRENTEPAKIKKTRIYKDQVGMQDELESIRETHRKMSDVVKDMMSSLKRNNKIDIEGTRQALKPMVDSIIRNPDALLWLNRLRVLDDYNYSHALGCSIWAMSLGRQLGMSRIDIESLGLGALLLDIGKTKLPKGLLTKSDPLSDSELKQVKDHVKLSMSLIRDEKSVNVKVKNMVETHHERINGSGYPLGLRGDAIPLFGRIAAIVDCYDAITSDRVYAKPLSSQDAVKKIYEWRGKDFQKELVEEFIQAIGMFPAGTLVELSSGEVGVVVSESRVRRLRPKIMLLLNVDKTNREDYVICNLMTTTHDEQGKPLDIAHALPAGSFGINADDYYL